MKQPDPTEETLERLFEPVAAGRGLELVAVELKGGRGSRLLRVTIERPGGAIDVADCAGFSREISALLDVEDPVAGSFHLEVSSPGVERPLRKRRDFERFAGEEVSIRHRTAGGRRTVSGVLRGIDASDQVLLETGTGVERVAFDSVENAHIVFHFGKAPTRST